MKVPNPVRLFHITAIANLRASHTKTLPTKVRNERGL